MAVLFVRVQFFFSRDFKNLGPFFPEGIQNPFQGIFSNPAHDEVSNNVLH